MVDVVDVALAVAQFHQRLDAGHDIVAVERALRVGLVEVEAHVHLDAAHRRQVVAVRIEEQRVEERGRGLLGGRLAGAHDAIDVHERAFAAHVLVHRHGVADVRADVDAVDVEHRDIGDAGVEQRLQRAAGDRAVLVALEVSSSPASTWIAPVSSLMMSRATNLPTICSNGTRSSVTCPRR